MYSGTGDTTSLVPGFPIRTSSDPRSVDSSPRHIAASYVLHRLPVPRHPPCALKHLHTKQLKILGRIRNCTSTTRPTPPHKGGLRAAQMLATTIHKSNTTPHHQSRATTTNPEQPGRHPHHGSNIPPVSHTRDEEIAGLLSQSPIVCLAIPSPQFDHPDPLRLNVCRAPEPHPLQVRPIHRIAQVTVIRRHAGRPRSRGAP